MKRGKGTADHMISLSNWLTIACREKMKEKLGKPVAKWHQMVSGTLTPLSIHPSVVCPSFCLSPSLLASSETWLASWEGWLAGWL